MFSISYCGKSSTEIENLAVVERPSLPNPIKRVESVRVPGRSGYLHFTDNTYDGIDIIVKFNFMANSETLFNIILNAIKAWLYTDTDDKKLMFSDNPSQFYSVIYTEMGDVERKNLVGNFSVIFHCEPYRYEESSFVEKPLNQRSSYYGAAEVFPLYKVVMPSNHSGYIGLDGKPTVSFTSSADSIVIDTKLGIAYTQPEGGFVEIDGDIDDLTIRVADAINGVTRVNVTTDCTGTRIDRGGFV